MTIFQSPLPIRPSASLCIIALGSNQGDAAQNIRTAFARLQSLSDRPLLPSSLWETAPVDCPPGSPMFINAIAAFEPRAAETPQTLLARLQALEKELGRPPKKIHNEPRPIDLDLIAFGQHIINTPELKLPHPRAHQRRFVLQPLSEIAPAYILPNQSKSVSELLRNMESKTG